MATFKPGDRVKRVINGSGMVNGTYLHGAVPDGSVGTVEKLDLDGDCYVRFDCRSYEAVICFKWTLAPLTNPDTWADAQIAKLKGLGPLKEPVPSVRERIEELTHGG